MRKFVIKNRQKRKYTKKTEEVSSFSFSKTAYGMVPLLVMLVAFMSTIVISTPFRDALSNIRFNFEPPQFSLSNPIAFIQSVTGNVTQLNLLIWTIMLAVSSAFTQSIAVFFSSIGHTMGIIQNNAELQREASWNALTFFGQEIVKGQSVIGQALSILWYYCATAIQAVVTAITNTIIYIGQLITTAAISVVQTIIFAFTYVAHLVLAACLAVFTFFAVIWEAIWRIIVSVATFIASTTQHIINAVVYLIELPFKILYAFWLKTKPYVDILGRHIQMTGGDFENGFASWGKVASLMGSSK